MDDALLQWMMVDRHGLEDMSPGRPAWMAEAACAGHPTSVFFPGKGTRPDEAVAICQECPVAGPCLDLALAEDLTHGVWGGLSGAQRRRLAA